VINIRDANHRLLRGEVAPDFLKFVIDKMIDKLISRLANPHEATARIWGYHELRDLRGLPWGMDGLWIKVERARIQATPEEAQLGNWKQELDDIKYILSHKTLTQKEIENKEARQAKLNAKIEQFKSAHEHQINAYMGWFEIPLEEEFLREIFQFFIGDLQDQVAWMRHLLKISEQMYREGRFTDVIPEVVTRSTIFLYILGDQYNKLNKLRKERKHELWRSYFEEVLFARLLQIKDYDEPLSLYGLNGKILKAITREGEILRPIIEENDKKITPDNAVRADKIKKFIEQLIEDIKNLDDNRFVGYKILKDLFEITRTRFEDIDQRGKIKLFNAEGIHQYIVQEIVDQILLPPAFTSLKDADLLHYTAPTKLFSLPRMLIGIKYFDPILLAIVGIGFVVLGPFGGLGWISGLSVIPAVLVTSSLFAVKIVQMVLDHQEKDGFRKLLDTLTKGQRGLYDTELEILQRMADVGEEEYGGLSKDAWDRLSDAEQVKIKNSIGHWLKWGRIVPGWKEGIAFAAVVSITYAVVSITGLPVWFAVIIALAVMIGWQECKAKNSNHAFSYPGFFNLLMPVFSWLFAAPMVANVAGISVLLGVADYLMFGLIMLPTHFILFMFFIFMIRSGIYFSQAGVNKKAIAERHMFDIRYNNDIEFALIALNIKLGKGNIAIIEEARRTAIISGVLTGFGVIVGSSLLALGLITGILPLVLIAGASLFIAGISAYYFWASSRQVTLFDDLQLDNFQIKNPLVEKQLKSRALDMYEYEVSCLLDGTITPAEYKKLISFEAVPFNNPKAYERMKNILNKFYRKDIQALIHHWTSRPLMTGYNSAFNENFANVWNHNQRDPTGKRLLSNEETGADDDTKKGIINYTVLDEKGKFVLKKGAYPTELNHLVVNAYPQEWQNFVEIMSVKKLSTQMREQCC